MGETTVAPVTGTEIERWQSVLASIYGNARTTTPVIVADGYTVTISVHRGQLVIRDGIGRHARTRELYRSDRTVKRIVVLGHSGTITLDALRWCNDVGVTLAVIGRDGKLAAVTTNPNPFDARIRRAQAAADGTELGDRIASFLITEKIRGQNAILTGWGIESPEIELYLKKLSKTATTAEVNEYESRSANSYFKEWSGRVRPVFRSSQNGRVPPAWLRPFGRRSPVTRSSSRVAGDPINAMLNYAYSLGEVIVRQNALILGIDPALGILHRDKRYRDSMVFDLIEPLRPVIDRDLIRYLETREFKRTDFIETPDGNCQLAEPITHTLAHYMPAWSSEIAPTVETVAHMLSTSATGKVRTRTPLTNMNGTNPTRAPRVCRDCGNTVNNARSYWCEECRTLRAGKSRTERRKHDRRRNNSDNPKTEAKRKTADAIAEWEAENLESFPLTIDDYTVRIYPAISQLRPKEISEATGMSRGYASRIRHGQNIPHRRYWTALAALSTNNKSQSGDNQQ